MKTNTLSVSRVLIDFNGVVIGSLGEFQCSTSLFWRFHWIKGELPTFITFLLLFQIQQLKKKLKNEKKKKKKNQKSEKGTFPNRALGIADIFV
jgi:hypothetical protein